MHFKPTLFLLLTAASKTAASQTDPLSHFDTSAPISSIYTDEDFSDTHPGDINTSICRHQTTCVFNPKNTELITLCDENSKAALQVVTVNSPSSPSKPGSYSHFVNTAHSVCNFPTLNKKPSTHFSIRDIDESIRCAAETAENTVVLLKMGKKTKQDPRWGVNYIPFKKGCAALFKPATTRPPQSQAEAEATPLQQTKKYHEL